MNGPMADRSKIGADHLGRLAFVYVRQSSLRQVRENLESQRRQYGFADHAAALGWSSDKIIVVDEDQGKSGAIPDSRSGFGRLVAAVARGEAGVVMSLEVSRLSRNDSDWHQLVHLCRWTGTLIADEHGVYDPSSSADRMVLGVRGQVSELERDNSVHRMVEARWSKARRGESFTILPAGYEYDDLGAVALTNDEAVLTAVRRVFVKFDELGAGRQVFLWWKEEGLPFPARRTTRSHPIAWVPVSYRAVMRMLHHPIYAGTFVFGRNETRRELDPETRKLVVRSVKRKEAPPVLLRDHHPAYISFEKYQQNQKRILGNEVMKSGRDESHQGPPREGKALLQGLVRCGHCGRRMMVGYGGLKAARTLQYRCPRILVTTEPGPECQLLGGKRIESAVVAVFLEVLQPAGMEAAALANETLEQEIAGAEDAWRLQIEKAEFEAQRAERQYLMVEPENRTVARALERRWNERLTELEEVRTKAGAAREHRRPLTAQELVRANSLGKDVESIWNAPTTEIRDKKRLLRTLIEEVQLRTEETRYLVRIVWKGGAVTDREVARLARGQQPTSEDTIELVQKLATQFDDTQIARILHRQGRRSGSGLPFTKSRVSSLRQRHQIPICPKTITRDERAGPFTADEAARELGVNASTIHRWLRDGVLPGSQMAPAAPWQITLTDELRHRLAGGPAPGTWVGLTEAARRLGVSKSLAAYWVKQGKLTAMRTTVGKRECWKIDVSSADCGRQPEFPDQMPSPHIKES